MNDYPRDQWCTCTPRHEWHDPASRNTPDVGTAETKKAFEYPPPGDRADGWFKRCVRLGFVEGDGGRVAEGWDGGCFVAG
ncbi:hypothetical protein MMC30_009387 [Trapelia coarctata]|nr:hypothetical protein [Trapelia coarctata]